MKHSFYLAFSFGFCVLFGSPVNGQVKTTISTPSGGTITGVGPVGAQTITIPASLGQQSGSNLLHSFNQFNVGSGDTALFTQTGLTTLTPISNIIARINSISASNINGAIKVDPSSPLFSNANLFLINPNGVIFGNGASVSVPGNFVVSSANYIKLSDGSGVIYANPTTGKDNLTSAPIASFGFFKNTTPAPISVNGANLSNSAGGGIQIVGGAFTAAGASSLTTTSANLGIFSGGATGSSDQTAPYLTGPIANYSTASFTKLGNVTLGGATPGSGASLKVKGSGGHLVIRGGVLTVQQGSNISSSPGSDINLQGDSVNLSGGSSIASQSSSAAAGDAGQINITTNLLSLQSGTSLTSGSAINVTSSSTGSVNNGGSISAGVVTMSPGGPGTLAIDNSGTISATGNKKAKGQINLASNGGTITNSGKIAATNPNGDGGTIALNSTGTTSSGTLTNSGMIDASATVAKGNGGSVSLKSMGGTTTQSGQIFAKGGQGGTGGDAEVSGSQVNFTGTVDLTAPGGQTGNLLFDPATLTVVTGGTVTGGSFTSSGGTDTNPTDGTANDTVDPSVVDGLLGTANVTLNADTNITVTSGITWTSANKLTLSTNTAGSTINLNAPISGINGGLTIDTKAATDSIKTGASGSVAVANFILQNGAWSQISATLPAFSATNDFELNGTSTFKRFTGGNGTSNPYQIVDIYGLQGLATLPINTNAELMSNIDASGTATWNGNTGFVPIGTNGSTNNYTGTFNGQGKTIDGLTINTSGFSDIGLFGVTGTGATIENVGLTNASISGKSLVGAVVGLNGTGSTITNVTSAGSITGASGGGSVGGVVGENDGTLSLSNSAATITGNGGTAIGGLVGFNNSTGSINQSFSTGAVSGTGNSLGGLVGENDGGLSASYSTGAVTGGSGTTAIGGLVGLNTGTPAKINNTYSTGDVSTGIGSTDVGGLVGNAATNSSISNSYSTGAVSAGTGSTNKGGLVGRKSNSATLSGNYWAQDTGWNGGLFGIGSNPSNMNAAPESFANLNSQSTFANWDFTATWNTYGNVTSPKLQGVGDGSFTNVLSGIDYSDSGVTVAGEGTTIEMISGGAVLGTTATTGIGVFNFFFNSTTNLKNGVLLTDATNSGNAYYQANTPATGTAVNIWGGTLRITGDTASNTALGAAAGTGSNYTVTSNNLATNSGVNLVINSTNYTLDGNITAGGSLTTAAGSTLTTSVNNVTLSASSMNLGGSISSANSLLLTNTGSGALINSGSISADTLTITSSGNVINSSQINGANSGTAAITTTGTATLDNSGTISAGTVTINSAADVTNSSQINGTSSGTASITTTTASGTLHNSGTISAGTVTINSSADITDNGKIQTTGAGGVTVNANAKDAGSLAVTGSIFSQDAGAVNVTSSGTLAINSGGQIYSTSSSAVGGAVTVSAATLNLTGNTKAEIATSTSGALAAGNLTINSSTNTGSVTLATGAQISSTTTSSGSAGTITIYDTSLGVPSGTSITSANTVTIKSTTTGVVNNAGTISGSSVDITSAGNVINSSQINGANSGTAAITTTGTATLNNSGTISAGSVTINSAADVTNSSQINGTSSGTASITTTTANGTLHNSGTISAGTVTINSSADITDNGKIQTTGAGGITVNANATDGNSLKITGAGNGIFSVNAGSLAVTSKGTLTINTGAQIYSKSISSTAGAVTVTAATLTLTGSGPEITTSGSNGFAAGNLTINGLGSEGSVSLLSGAQISSTATGGGSSGVVTIYDTSLTVPSTTSITSGNSVTVNSLTGGVNNGGSISAGTVTINSTGDVTDSGTIQTTGSGGVYVNANATDAGSLTVTGSIYSQDAGNVNVTSSGTLAINGGGQIYSTSISAAGGTVTVSAATLNLAGNTKAEITTSGSNGFDAGNLTINSSTNPGSVTLATGAKISSTISGSGNAGTITIYDTSLGVQSGTSITSANTVTVNSGTNGITNSGTISAGTVTINSAADITDNGKIQTTGAGGVTVNAYATDAGSLAVNGSITSQDAGNVNVTSLGTISIDSGGQISSSASGTGNGGTVTVTASGDIVLGDASGGVGLINSSTSLTQQGAGDAGAVAVNDSLGNITLNPNSQISSISSGNGTAGDVSVNSGVTKADSTKTISITGTGSSALNTGIFSESTSKGNAGAVDVTSIGNITLTNGGQIASLANAKSSGTASNVSVTLNSGTLTAGGIASSMLPNGIPTPIIYSMSVNPANKDGNVTVNAFPAFVILNGASIQTSTQDAQAGNVEVDAATLTLNTNSTIESIMSTTDTTHTGRTGNITVNVIGSLTMASGTHIRTSASPANAPKFAYNPVGTVAVHAGTTTNPLTENGNAIPIDASGNYENQLPNDPFISSTNANNTYAANQEGPPATTVTTYTGGGSSSNSLGSPALGIVVDSTLTATSFTIQPTDPNGTSWIYTIDPSDGITLGTNLFLSFSQFNLGVYHPAPGQTVLVPETAVFNAPGVANILARVTGGQLSQIDGDIQEMAGTKANLFFLNSSGVLFTKNSNLNNISNGSGLGGALTVTTANFVTLGGMGEFYSAGNLTWDSEIKSKSTTAVTAFNAPVTDFGFTTGTPASINFDFANLQNNDPIQIIGGNITVSNGAVLSANSSPILLFSAGTVTSSNADLSFSLGSFSSGTQSLAENGFGSMGQIKITNNSIVNASSSDLGSPSTILIRGSDFTLQDSSVINQTTATQSTSTAGQVIIDTTNTAKIISDAPATPSYIVTSTFGAANGGTVEIDTNSLTIQGSNTVFTGIFSNAEPATFYSNNGNTPSPYPYSAYSLSSYGQAGNINLNLSGMLSVSGSGQISANTTGPGSGGNITVNNLNGSNFPQITIQSGGTITSATSLGNTTNFSSTGAAGSITINAGSLSVSGNQSLITTSAGLASNSTFDVPAAMTGPGGTISITSVGQTGGGNGDISISSGGEISASSFTSGLGGKVQIMQTNSTDGILIDGSGSLNTGILATLYGDGSANSGAAIYLNTTSPLTIKNGGQINTSTSNQGNSGSISIYSGTLAVNSHGNISSSTTGSGTGGDIGLNIIGDVAITSGGQVTASSSSTATGYSGQITVNQSGSSDVDPTGVKHGGIWIDGAGSSISTTAGSTSGTETIPTGVTPGKITLTSDALSLSNGASIDSSSFGNYKAGDITINGYVANNTQFVSLTGGSTINSTTNGAGNGGTITIQTGALSLDGAATSISTNAAAGTGNGGSISLTVKEATASGSSGDVALTHGAQITASSSGTSTGYSGAITITQSGSTDVDPTGVTHGGIWIDGAGSSISTAAGSLTSNPSLGAVTHPGLITLTTDALTLSNKGSVNSSTNGPYDAGDITINGYVANNTQFVSLNGGSTINSTTNGAGNGGTITIQTGALSLDGAATSISTNAAAGAGNGGSILLTVNEATASGSTGDVALTNGAEITASSSGTSTGYSGAITITQSGSLDVDPTGVTHGGIWIDGLSSSISTAAGSFTFSPSLGAVAHPGLITLTTDALTLTNKGSVNSSTNGPYDAGDIAIKGHVANNTQFVSLSGGSTINSTTNGAGKGGTLAMDAATLTITGTGTSISTSSTGTTTPAGTGGTLNLTIKGAVDIADGGSITSGTSGNGDAGVVNLSAGSLSIDGATSNLSTSSTGSTSVYSANIGSTTTPVVVGTINLDVGGAINITNGGNIDATTSTVKNGGDINITSGSLNLIGSGTTITADASGTVNPVVNQGTIVNENLVTGINASGKKIRAGDGGDITIKTSGNISVSEQASITSSSLNTNAGHITIIADKLSLVSGGNIDTTAAALGVTNSAYPIGNGGGITVFVNHLLYLLNGKIITHATNVGGNIYVDPQFVILGNSQIDAFGQFGDGNINIFADFVLNSGSTITASGAVNIDSLPLDLTGSLIALPANLTNEQHRLRDSCARAINHEFSSLIVVGRGGTETAPDEVDSYSGVESLGGSSIDGAQAQRKIP